MKNYSLLLFFVLIATTFSQEIKTKKDTIIINSSITATNNGISVIPTFSLGKPAAIFDLSITKKRFSFEPQFRFGLEDAKPWSFAFWMRYKLLNSKTFKLGVGANPAYVFQSIPVVTNGISSTIITTKRFVGGDVVPTFVVNKKVSFGLYYLYSHGLDDSTKNTNFVSLNGYFSNIKLFDGYNLKIVPQIYYLKMDETNGFYSATNITLAKSKIPFSIASTFNKTINSTIPSKDFIWNVSLIYSFGGKYILQ